MNREIQNLLFTIRDDTSRFKYDYGFEDDNKILIKAKIGDWIMLLEEIERLNNVINELEHHLYQEWLEWKDSDCESIYSRAGEDKAIYDYLQELKGSDKE